MEANGNEVWQLAQLMTQHIVDATRQDASTTLIYESLRKGVGKFPSLARQSNKLFVMGLEAGVILEMFNMGRCQLTEFIFGSMSDCFEKRETPYRGVHAQDILRSDQVPHFFLHVILRSIETLRFEQSWRDAAYRLQSHVKIDWPIPNTPFDDDSPYTDFNDDDVDEDSDCGDGYE